MNRIAFALVLTVSVSGCGGLIEAGDNGSVGAAEARITQVPAMVGCVSVTVAGSRTVTSSLNVTVGETATLRLKNLPVGNDTFTAFAYAAGCNQVAGTQPSWASDPAVTAIAAGKVASLSLTLRPSGGASVGVGFADDGGGATDGGPGGDGGGFGGGTGGDGGARSDGGAATDGGLIP